MTSASACLPLECTGSEKHGTTPPVSYMAANTPKRELGTTVQVRVQNNCIINIAEANKQTCSITSLNHSHLCYGRMLLISSQ